MTNLYEKQGTSCFPSTCPTCSGFKERTFKSGWQAPLRKCYTSAHVHPRLLAAGDFFAHNVRFLFYRNGQGDYFLIGIKVSDWPFAVSRKMCHIFAYECKEELL